MEPKEAWGAFSILVVFADAVAVALLIDMEYEPVLIAAVAFTVLLLYFYVLYKRYHVEVVPENDIMMFDDPDDLRILSSIYGLDSSGNETELRQRLVAFARAHNEDSFVWVAPKTVLFFGSALEIPQTPVRPSGRPAKSLLKEPGKASASALGLEKCPICNTKAPTKGLTCTKCGADLGFYLALSGSKVGKMVVSERASEVQGKPRYKVRSIRESK